MEEKVAQMFMVYMPSEKATACLLYTSNQDEDIKTLAISTQNDEIKIKIN